MTLDTQDEVLKAYIEKSSPVNITLDGRISTTDETEPANSENPSTTSAAPNGTVSATSSASATESAPGSSGAVIVSSRWSLIAAVVGVVVLGF